MKFKTSLIFSLLFLPLVSKAQTLQVFFPALVDFLGGTVLNFLYALAFLFFVISVVRYMIIGSAEEEGRKQAKALLIWSVVAFLLMSTFFAIVNLLLNSIGLTDGSQTPSDYVCPNGLCPEYMEPEWVPGVDDPCSNPDDPACEAGRT